MHSSSDCINLQLKPFRNKDLSNDLTVHCLTAWNVISSPGNPPLSATHLNEDVQKKFKVLIKRHEQTVGLIGAKKTGGDAATGDVIVFFDCHVGHFGLKSLTVFAVVDSTKEH